MVEHCQAISRSVRHPLLFNHIRARKVLATTAEVMRLHVENATSGEWLWVATPRVDRRMKAGPSQPLCQRRQLTVAENWRRIQPTADQHNRGNILIIITHTHTHPRLTALCPGLPGWAGTRKVKPIWILLKQETVSGSGITWAICKSAPRSRQITMPATHHSVFYRPDPIPATQPTASKHWRDITKQCGKYNGRVFSFSSNQLLCRITLRWAWGLIKQKPSRLLLPAVRLKMLKTEANAKHLLIVNINPMVRLY